MGVIPAKAGTHSQTSLPQQGMRRVRWQKFQAQEPRFL